MNKKIRVCNGRTCSCHNSEIIMEAIEEATGLRAGQKNDDYDLDYGSCTSYCELARNVTVDDKKIIHRADPATIMTKIKNNEGTDKVFETSDIDIDKLLEL